MSVVVVVIVAAAAVLVLVLVLVLLLLGKSDLIQIPTIPAFCAYGFVEQLYFQDSRFLSRFSHI